MVLQLKKERKDLIQQQLELTRDPRAILVSFVGRLAEQKGLDLLYTPIGHGRGSLLWELLDADPHTQLVFAGPPTIDDSSVAPFLQELFRVKREFGRRLAVCLEYVEHSRALEIIHASDLFIMPSRFEPGGITQLESLALGTPVVARSVGGLANTLVHFEEATLSGNAYLCFEHSPMAFFNTLRWAIGVQRNPTAREAILANSVHASHDWNDRVPFYRALFQKLALPPHIGSALPYASENAELLRSSSP